MYGHNHSLDILSQNEREIINKSYSVMKQSKMNELKISFHETNDMASKI